MNLSSELLARLSQIKAVVFDCDGVMTTGQITYAGDGQWVRPFSILDGMGIKRLQAAQIHVGMITNSKSEDIRERCKSLGIDKLYEGASNKVDCMAELCQLWELEHSEVAYMGDDLQDVPVLALVGLAVTVPHADQTIKAVAHYVTEKQGGCGAVRELCELILEMQSNT